MKKSQPAVDEELQESPPKYSIDELVAAAGPAFNTQPEVVYAALLSKRITEATKEEAQAAVDDFMNKEV